MPLNRILICTLFFAFIFSATLPAEALPIDGQLDLTFNQNRGYRYFDAHRYNDYVSDSCVQADGKTVLVGRADSGSYSVLSMYAFVARVDSNGTRDQTFGENGTVVLTAERPTRIDISSVLCLNDGKIVVGGDNYQSGTWVNSFVARFNPDGSADAGFGTNGRYFFDAGGTKYLHSLALQAGGKIVAVGGASPAGANSELIAIRILQSGVLDTTFGNGGIVRSTPYQNLPCPASGTAVQPDDKILIGCTSPNPLGSDFGVIRLGPDGSFDTAFGTGGVAVADFRGSDYVARIMIQPDGKIVAAGNFYPQGASQSRFALARFTQHGAPDLGFGTNGTATNNSSGYVMSGLIKDDGIYLGGYSDNQLAIWRITFNGASDASFGTNGRLRIVLGFQSWAATLAGGPDGKVQAYGLISKWEPIGEDTGVFAGGIRLNSNGSPDPTYALNGVLQFNSRRPDNLGNAISIRSDGTIIAAGGSRSVFGFDGTILSLNYDGSRNYVLGDGAGNIIDEVSHDDDMITGAVALPNGESLVTGVVYEGTNKRSYIAKYRPKGDRDGSFARRGLLFLDNGGADLKTTDIGPLPDGRFLVIGTTGGKQPQAFLAEFHPNGEFDASFATNGWFRFSLSSGSVAEEFAVQPDGKILICGNTGSGDEDLFVARLTAFGELDAGFGDNGIVVRRVSAADDSARAIVVQPDGKIVISGRSGVSQIWTVARFESNGAVDTSFGTDGIVTTSVGEPSDSNSIFVLPDSRIIAVGTASNGNSKAIALARYLPNGQLDQTFGSGGTSTTVVGASSEALDAAIQKDGRILVSGVSDGRFLVARFWNKMNRRARFDFDGDGASDIAVLRTQGSPWGWWIDQTTMGPLHDWEFYPLGTACVADFSGDGRTDLTWLGAADWNILNSEDRSWGHVEFGFSSDIHIPEDYDGDRRDDPAVFRPSNSTWYIRNSSGGVTIETFGISGDMPAPADFDGDGKADIAVFRPSTGQWWLKRSRDGIASITFGSSIDKPLPRDYTGDGKADLAFWRPSTGEWFILRSEDGSFYSFPLGSANDVPAPADYDGDGKTDAGVFRDSNATWYINRSSAGPLVKKFGIPGDRPLSGIDFTSEITGSVAVCR